MNQLPDHLFRKIESISHEVKKNLRKKGIAIPMDNEDGTISLGDYKIVKIDGNFYSVLDNTNNPVVEKINLPQTAVMLANDLALGKFLNHRLLELDRNYGYALFEETLTKKSLKNVRKPLDQYEIMNTKCLIAQAKKTNYRHEIIKSFEKLRKLA